jgi:hypothetical protein
VAVLYQLNSFARDALNFSLQQKFVDYLIGLNRIKLLHSDECCDDNSLGLIKPQELFLSSLVDPVAEVFFRFACLPKKTL